MSLILDLFFQCFFSFVQALAGIVAPTKREHLVRKQKWAAAILVLGSLTIAAGIWVPMNGWLTFGAIAGGIVAVIVAGVLGYYIESEARSEY